MAPNVGTYTIDSLLEVQFSSVNDFGFNTVVEVLQTDLAAHNRVVTEMISEMAEVTTGTQGVYGTGATGEMQEVDEFGRAETQVVAPGSTVAFPLRLFQYPIGWTDKYMQAATPADLARAQLAAETAHMKAIRRDIKRAFFYSSNYTWIDFLIDKVSYGVKRLVNADSASIPDAPDGSTFDAATHTHYVGSATLTTTAVTAAINNLIEHGHGSKVMIAVNHANAAAMVALTGFVKAQPVYIQQLANTLSMPGQRTDMANQYNRLLGYYESAEVWVKPWAIANYLVVWDGGTTQKPLAFRQRTATSLQGLRIAAELPAYPLFARYFEAEFGVAVKTRTNGVVLEFDNASYGDPTIS
jgi:hypothetical protein